MNAIKALFASGCLAVVYCLFIPCSGTFAADYDISGSRSSTLSVATDDTVLVEGTANWNVTSTSHGISGAAADNVVVTVKSGAKMTARGTSVSGNANTGGRVIYLGNYSDITVENGALIENYGYDGMGNDSINSVGIYTGSYADIRIAGTVWTYNRDGRTGGGYNNYQAGIMSGAGANITVTSTGLVKSSAFNGCAIDLPSGGTVTNSGTILSPNLSYDGAAAIRARAGNTTVNNDGIIQSNAYSAIILGTGDTSTGNTLNVYGSSSIIGNLKNEGAAGGATVNFGYNGSSADTSANTTITGSIGNAGNAWNGRAYAGTNTVTGSANFRDVQLDAGAVLNVGGTLDISNSLGVEIYSLSSYGKITSTGVVTVNANSLDVTLSGYLADKDQLTIIEGASGSAYNFSTVTSSSPYYSFTYATSGGNLILTANRSSSGGGSAGFAGAAGNSNARSAAEVLDNIPNPTGDMARVLNTLEGLNETQVASALDSLIPQVDNSLPQVNHLTWDGFVGTVVDHLDGLRLAGASSETGVSAGEAPANNAIWAKGFGSYLHQDPRGSSNGYRAGIYGTSMGCDSLVYDGVRLGGSFGYAYDDIRSKDNSNSTDIDSYQVTLYAGLTCSADYLNGAASFAYNSYNGTRNINFPGVNRAANSDYHGRQYGFYLEGGHVFRKGAFELTPLASIKYEHLGTESYTERDAGALNLRMDRQGYNMVQSGLGGKASYSLKCGLGYLIPEMHAKWLYDIVNDDEESVSAFTGGGASFATQGYQPAKGSADVGAKLTLLTKANLEISLDYGYQVKKDFYSHSGLLNARYTF
jgi:uncharacterized protein with beta-barrel porin domain